jgi:hypothetical protein
MRPHFLPHTKPRAQQPPCPLRDADVTPLERRLRPLQPLACIAVLAITIAFSAGWPLGWAAA